MTALSAPRTDLEPLQFSRNTLAWIAAAAATVSASVVAGPFTSTLVVATSGRLLLLLLVAAVLAGSWLMSVRTLPAGPAAIGPLTATLSAALALGLLSPPPTFARAQELGVFFGLIAMSTVALVLRLAATDSIYERVLGIIPVWCMILGVGILTILVSGWPTAALAAVTAASTPMLLQMLPAVSIGIPSEQLLDHSVLMRLLWAARSPIPPSPRRIEFEQVQTLVRSGRLLHAASTLFWCLAAVVAYTVVVADGGSTMAEKIGTWVLGVGLVIFLLLSPRRSWARFDRWTPRLAAIVILAQLVLIWIPRVLPRGTGGIDTAVLVGVGVAAAVVAIPAGRGFTSLGVSRFADFLQGTAMFLIVPAGFVAGGFIELFRGLAS